MKARCFSMTDLSPLAAGSVHRSGVAWAVFLERCRNVMDLAIGGRWADIDIATLILCGYL